MGVTRLALGLSKIIFGKKYSKGHNARQFSDLTQYAPSGDLNLNSWKLDKLLESSIIEKEKNTKNFYIRTEKPDQLNHTIKTVELNSSSGNQAYLNIEQIQNEAKDLGIFMLECAGNDRYSKFGLMSASMWSGIKFEDLLKTDKRGLCFLGNFEIDKNATHVLIEGFDETKNTNWNRFPGLVESKPGASWIFTLEELKKHQAFLATKMNGQELSYDHGQPLRLVVPCFYGCASIKWLNKMTFFRPTHKTKTVAQMREFSDRTNQKGVPKYYKDHRSPVVDLASLAVNVEEWFDGTSKNKVMRIIGLTWGGIEHKNPRLKIIISKKVRKRRLIGKNIGNKSKVIEKILLEEEIKTAARLNTVSFSHWIHWWIPPGKGDYLVRVLPVDTKILARRLQTNYYQRMIRV